MKLRHHKRHRVARLRRRIALRELRRQWDKATDDLANELAEFILAPGRMFRQMVREIMAPILQAVVASGGLPGSTFSGVTGTAIPPMTIGLTPKDTYIEGCSASAPLTTYVDSTAASIAAVIALAGDELTKGDL